MSTFENTNTEKLTKLEGKGNQGDFVLENQELADKEGFGHVSKIWYDKTLSVDEALEHLFKDRETQKDVTVNSKKLVPYFNKETGEVGLENWEVEQRYKLTPYAWRQFASRVDVPHTYVNHNLNKTVKKYNGSDKYERDLQDAETFYTVMMNGFRRVEEKPLLVRTYNDNICRAILSDQYTCIDNEWFIKALGDLMPGARVSHYDYSDADTLQFNLLIPDTIRKEDDSDYGGMVSVTNCEIGKRTNSGTPSLFRAICMNGCIWDKTEGVSWVQRHKGKINTDDLLMIMARTIQAQIPLIDKYVTDFLASRKWELGKANMQQILTQLSLDNSLNGEQCIKLFEAFNEENIQNGFGVVNAMTRFAQTQDVETWRKMDLQAGLLIGSNGKQWERLVSRAQYLDDKDLEKVLKKKSNINQVFNMIAV